MGWAADGVGRRYGLQLPSPRQPGGSWSLATWRACPGVPSGRIQTTAHCHAMPYPCGCPGYICQPKTARWYMSDLEAPAGRSADLAYVIVTDDIAARIAAGELQPGARLLAERELAHRYGVAYGTIRRAMKELRARGLISSVQGRGTFVARQDGPPPGALSRGGIAAADGHLADHPVTATLPITLAPRHHAAPEAQSREPDGFTAAPGAPSALRVKRLRGQVACVVT